VASNGGFNLFRLTDSYEKTISVWGLKDGQFAREFDVHPKAVSMAAVFADGKRPLLSVAI
jgi:hypothetical protein